MQDHDARIARLLAFYRSAYLADSRDLNLDNLSALPAGRLAWLDGREELASGALPLLALPPGIGAELERQQRLYQRDCSWSTACCRCAGGSALKAAPQRRSAHRWFTTRPA
ncbi:hypothetical protein [Pseudomonas sp. sia0905]|uniref:hypothetical protein n=1 Tax=Pseudomonas sp. sia0905 TaxID=2854783 RepID=UPI0021088E6D|nr:hypothetical protein [Pseudomonas sp. sia0905]